MSYLPPWRCGTGVRDCLDALTILALVGGIVAAGYGAVLALVYVVLWALR